MQDPTCRFNTRFLNRVGLPYFLDRIQFIRTANLRYVNGLSTIQIHLFREIPNLPPLLSKGMVAAFRSACPILIRIWPNSLDELFLKYFPQLQGKCPEV